MKNKFVTPFLVLFGISVLSIISCASTPTGDNAMIIGKWTIDAGDGIASILEFFPNGRIRIANFAAGGIVRSDDTWRYEISGNNIIVNAGFGVKRTMTFDLSTPGVLRIYRFLGASGTNPVFYNFDNLIPSSVMIITGRWLYDDNQGNTTLWDFKTNTQVHIVTQIGGPQTTRERFYDYRISGNNLIIHSYGVMTFDLSSPGILKVGNYGGRQGLNVEFYPN